MQNETKEVSNVARSIDFYTQVAGMRLLNKYDYPDSRCTVAHLASCDAATVSSLTLSGSWSGPKTLVSSSPTITVVVEDVAKAKNACKYRSAEVLSVIEDSFLDLQVIVKDPDGYSVTLVSD